MTIAMPTEIVDIPQFFERLSQESVFQPVLLPADSDDRGGFNLLLRGEQKEILVYDRGQPAWFSDLGAAKFLLVHGYVREVLTVEALVEIRGYF